jgi:hypothetical protein
MVLVLRLVQGQGQVRRVRRVRRVSFPHLRLVVVGQSQPGWPVQRPSGKQQQQREVGKEAVAVAVAVAGASYTPF